MALLTKDECDTIEQMPFGDSLCVVREALRKAEPDAPGETLKSDASTDAPERPRLFVAAIDKLLLSMCTSMVAMSLASRTGRDILFSDLGYVRLRLQKGDLEYQHFHALSQLVLKQAPDVEIWGAVVAVIRAISHSTPPPSHPQSSNDTPISHSSASLHSETRKKIEDRVFEEIRHCTHRGVGGFHEKYFMGKKWNRRAERSWEAAKAHYNDSGKKWTQLPDAPTEDDVCSWWLGLQQKLLANERAAYFRSTQGNKVGDATTKRQLDLFVKRRRDEASDAKHDWRHVLVVGELKKSDQKDKALLLQIGSAVRNIFASQPTRLFVPAFTLAGTEMETWVFDRSGPYSGSTFDVHEDPEKFIRVMCGYLMMSDEELGLNAIIDEKDKRLSIIMPFEAHGTKRKPEVEEQELELDPTPIARQRAIVCRGTSCFLAKPAGAAKYDRVVKFSWTSNMRPPEADLLLKANDRGVRGLTKVVGYNKNITSISELRDGLVFSTKHKFRGIPRTAHTSFSQSQLPPSRSFSKFHGLSITRGSRKRNSSEGGSRASKRPRSNSQPADTANREEITYPVQEPEGTSLVQQDQDQPFDNRILRVLAIFPAGRPISQFKSVVELLEGFCDAIKVHQSLLEDGKILHRDISENNIILTDPNTANGFKGMLIDLDLGKEEGAGPSGARHRTGTMEFMAIEVLLEISHTYRHDLESFFYVFIWQCARRGWALVGASPSKKSKLLRWYTGDYEEIANTKLGHMDAGKGKGLDLILKEFPPEFDCVKHLCRTIRGILFPYKDGLFTGTPLDPKILYGPIINAFEDALKKVRETEAETYIN